MKPVFLFALCIAVCMISQASRVAREPSKRLCGEKLYDGIRLVCNSYGGYNGLHRRNIDDSSYQARKMEKRDEVLIDRALSIKKYGASSECCLRPCDYKTLAQYCRESPDLLDAKEIQEKLGFTNSTTSTASYSNALATTETTTKNVKSGDVHVEMQHVNHTNSFLNWQFGGQILFKDTPDWLHD
ncbi:insulin-like peptide [Artemia franciscana]|uniref:insulin-like peptide n=1 Tax=Artemia franciscana TaxID=6661 RepID=UPI0032DA3497